MPDDIEWIPLDEIGSWYTIRIKPVDENSGQSSDYRPGRNLHFMSPEPFMGILIALDKVWTVGK